MSDEARKFVVEIDAETYSVLEEFCEQIDEQDQRVMNYLLDQTLNEFVETYTNLKEGYVEYGHMNLEISHAFTETENEAYGHIEVF